MRQSIGKRAGRGKAVLGRVIILIAIGMAAASPKVCLADDPKPDPAGIATGDKTTAVDAGGNSFVVLEPTDKNDPDGTYGAGWNGVGASSYLGHAGQGVTGLLHGDTRQFLCQLGGATLCAVWAFGATFVVFTVVNKIRSMRVKPEVEQEGLDVPEFGMSAYPEDTAVCAEA
jgi:hypothetical protein